MSRPNFLNNYSQSTIPGQFNYRQSDFGTKFCSDARIRKIGILFLGTTWLWPTDSLHILLIKSSKMELSLHVLSNCVECWRYLNYFICLIHFMNVHYCVAVHIQGDTLSKRRKEGRKAVAQYSIGFALPAAVPVIQWMSDQCLFLVQCKFFSQLIRCTSSELFSVSYWSGGLLYTCCIGQKLRGKLVGGRNRVRVKREYDTLLVYPDR